MPLQLKTGAAGGGSWRAVPASGKLAVLRGSAQKVYDAILAAGPSNMWPFQDPQGINVATDIISTKDSAFFSGTSSDMVNGHPNPWVSSKQSQMGIPGGNPVRTFGATGSFECIFRTTTGGGIFGYQATDPANGHVPALYVGTDGYLRGSIFPAKFVAAAGPKVNDGVFHHAAVTWSGGSGGSAWLIVDGVITQTATGITPDFGPAWNNNAQIGVSYGMASNWPAHYSEGWSWFNGDIYYFAVYSKSFTEAQFAARAALRPRWQVVGGVSVKSGGVWRGAGYAGFPGEPSTPSVHAWNYYDLHTVWNEPTTGTPLDSFEVQLLNEAGAVLQTQVPVTGGPNSVNRNDYIWRSLAANTRYQVRVRTKGTNGLFSNWTAPLKVQMGQAEVSTPRSELRERDYYGYTSHSGATVGTWMTHVQPVNVRSTWFQINVYTVPAINPFCGGGATHRRANWIVANTDWGDVGVHNNPWDEGKSYGVGYDNAGTHQGIVLTTDGSAAWSSNRGAGNIHLWGFERYTYYWTDVTPAVPNGYW